MPHGHAICDRSPGRRAETSFPSSVVERSGLMGKNGTQDRRAGGRAVRVGALADLHVAKTSQGLVQPLLAQAAEAADVILLGGDLTDHGLPEEAHLLARELNAVKVPLV